MRILLTTFLLLIVGDVMAMTNNNIVFTGNIGIGKSGSIQNRSVLLTKKGVANYANHDYGSIAVQGNNAVGCFMEDLNGGVWEESCIQYDYNKNQFTTFKSNFASTKSADTHNYPYPYFDSSGYVHVAYGCHHTQLYYRKSTNPNDVSSWGSEVSTAIPNSTYATYPRVFVDASDDVYILYRSANAAGSLVHDRIRISKLSSGSWTTYSPVYWQQGLDSNLADGSRAYFEAWYDSGNIHVAFSIRDGNNNTVPVTTFNHMAYFRFDTTNDTWYKADGTSYAGASIDYTNADMFRDSATDGEGYYAMDVNVDNNGRAYILYAYQTTSTTDAWFEHADLWIAYYDSGWIRTKILDTDSARAGDLVIGADNSLNVFYIENAVSPRQLYRLKSTDAVNWTQTSITPVNTNLTVDPGIFTKRPPAGKPIIWITNGTGTEVYGMTIPQ